MLCTGNHWPSCVGSKCLSRLYFSRVLFKWFLPWRQIYVTDYYGAKLSFFNEHHHLMSSTKYKTGKLHRREAGDGSKHAEGGRKMISIQNVKCGR